jgi:single-stranded DNA-binding protein
MSNDINNVSLTGTVIGTPEFRKYGQNQDKSICTLRVQVSRNREYMGTVMATSCVVPVVLFSQTAERLMQEGIKAGDKVAIDRGEVRSSTRRLAGGEVTELQVTTMNIWRLGSAEQPKQKAEADSGIPDWADEEAGGAPKAGPSRNGPGRETVPPSKPEKDGDDIPF